MKIKTLFIVKEIPYPPIGGVCLRNWQNINIMMKYGEVAVFAIDNKELNIKELPGVKFFHYYNLNNEISSLDKINNESTQLASFSCKYIEDNYDNNAAKILNQIMIDFQPDLVIIEQLCLSKYLEIVNLYNCQVILDEHNIEGELLNQTKNNLTNLELNQIKNIEKQIIIKSDQTWVCSEEDLELIRKNYGNFNHIYLVPNGVNINGYNFSEYQPKPQGNKIIFSGYFPYEPNQFAAKLLIEEIFPSLQKKYPESHLMLVGYNPSEFMLNSAKNNDKIIVTGSVPDVKDYFFQANIMVVPIFQGGGTRLKILEAFASGCPVVSSSKGAEGLKVKDGEHLLIRDNISDIIEAVDNIWSDISLSQKLSESAYNLVKKLYSWQAVTDNIENAINKLFITEKKHEF